MNVSHMATKELDPERGREVAEQLRALGVTGVLVTAAEQGYITELACGMPQCLCPKECGGRHYFEPVSAPMDDWSPNHEHSPTPRREGGHRRPDNSVLAHVLCNRIDFSKTEGRPHQKDLDRVEAARKRCIDQRNPSSGG